MTICPKCWEEYKNEHCPYYVKICNNCRKMEQCLTKEKK